LNFFVFKMTKLCKQCPHGHRAGSNSQKKCHICGHRFYKKRYSPKMNYTKKCPSCKMCVGGNNTKICKKCGHIFKKSGAKQIDAKQKEDQQIEDDLDWFLQELANEIKTGIAV